MLLKIKQLAGGLVANAERSPPPSLKRHLEVKTMPHSPAYSAGPWKLVQNSSSTPLFLVHAPTDTHLFELDECTGLGSEAKKILKLIEIAPQLLAELVASLHQIHVVASNHHAMALNAAGKKEQVELLAEGLGAVMSLAQTALAEASA